MNCLRIILWSRVVGIIVALSASAPFDDRAAHAFTADSADNEARHSDAEVIRERFSDGKIKIEREVTTDDDGNYVNHGTWRMWNTTGRLMATGQYEMGRRTGEWMRWYDRSESPLLSEHPFRDFEAPFASRATFAEGQLHGQWVITDAKDRKCSQVSLSRGKRDGTATLWMPDGNVIREATFRRGLAVGDVLQRGEDGELIAVANYIDGHQVVNKVTYFPGTKIKKTDSTYVTAAAIDRTPDDYWALRFASYESQGEEQLHGPSTTWYPNGQLESEGYFHFGTKNGEFRWWHANGQLAVTGTFVDGQEDGAWVWWHANGQKATQGTFTYGSLVGSWRGWNEDGRLIQREQYADGRALKLEGQAAAIQVRQPKVAGRIVTQGE